MGLFTSNFKRFRLVIPCIILAAGTLIIALLNLVIHHLDSSIYRAEAEKKSFWNRKINPTARYNLVIYGDSRANRGLAPHIFKKNLGIDVFNGAFTGGGQNKTIFKHISEKLLLPQPHKPRAVLLALTPLSMTEYSRKNGQYYSLLLSPASRSWEDPVVDFFFRNDALKNYRRSLKNKKKKRASISIYHSDGWRETVGRHSQKLFSRGLKSYISNYKMTTYDPRCLKDVVEQTAAWRRENVLVFGFWMPSCPEMEALEIEKSGCSMNDVKAAFTKAGGIWLDVDNRSQYRAYDASHLLNDEALKLSENLSGKIKKFM